MVLAVFRGGIPDGQVALGPVSLRTFLLPILENLLRHYFLGAFFIFFRGSYLNDFLSLQGQE